MDEYIRQSTFQDRATPFNETNFLIQQLLDGVQTALPVKILAVYPDAEFTGLVDIQPLVQQIAGDDSLIDRGVIHNVPYTRIQGGVNAIIIDPVIGDIGIAVFCSRDISTVKKTKSISPPASYRAHSFSDGLYIGGILNATPTRFIKFTETGIEIKASDTLTINSKVVINGDVLINGTLTNNAVNLTTHVHSDPQGSVTGVPQ